MTGISTRPEPKWSKQEVKEGRSNWRGKDLLAHYCRKVSKLVGAVIPQSSNVIANDTFVPIFTGHGMLDSLTKQPLWSTNDTRLSCLGLRGIRLPCDMDSHVIISAHKKARFAGPSV